jgi:single-strand DNA-binding protein
MNAVVLSGNVVAKPERIGEGTEDKSVARLRVAVRSASNKKDEDGKSEAGFFDVTAFGWAAVRALELDKGDPIVVNGRLQMDSWEKDGERRSKTCVIANEVVRGVRGTAHTETAGEDPYKEDVS